MKIRPQFSDKSWLDGSGGLLLSINKKFAPIQVRALLHVAGPTNGPFQETTADTSELQLATDDFYPEHTEDKRSIATQADITQPFQSYSRQPTPQVDNVALPPGWETNCTKDAQRLVYYVSCLL